MPALRSMYYVYLLKKKNRTTYVGCTKDLKERMRRHKTGEIATTSQHLPVRLVCYIAFENKYRAFEFERYLKTGSGRSFLKRHFLGG